jgi:hypothetical protein
MTSEPLSPDGVSPLPGSPLARSSQRSCLATSPGCFSGSHVAGPSGYVGRFLEAVLPGRMRAESPDEQALDELDRAVDIGLGGRPVGDGDAHSPGQAFGPFRPDLPDPFGRSTGACLGLAQCARNRVDGISCTLCRIACPGGLVGAQPGGGSRTRSSPGRRARSSPTGPLAGP